MRFRLEQRDQLQRWAEQGLFTANEWRELQGRNRLQPGSDEWRGLLQQLSVWTGTMALGSGMIFFLAFNWADMSRFLKLGLVGGLLTGMTLLAAWLTDGSSARRAALLGCSLATGALLALTGQIYQTGADIWQLFAAWALLMLPWALLARSSACWLLWVLLLNLALVRWLHLYPAGFWHLPEQLALLPAALNFLLYLLFESQSSRLLQQPRLWLVRLTGLLALVSVLPGALMAFWNSAFISQLLVWGGLCTLGIPWCLKGRRDLPLLAVQLFSGVAVVASALGRVLEALDAFLLFNALAAWVVFGSVMVSLWVQRLHREQQL